MSTLRRTATLAIVLAGLAGCASAPGLPIYGTWKITSFAAPGSTAAAPVPVLAYVGLSASFGIGDARFGGDRCGVPNYTPRKLSASEFQQEFKVAGSTLGITEDPVQVYTVACGVPWNSHVSTLIIKSPTTLLTPLDGRFFEMAKR